MISTSYATSRFPSPAKQPRVAACWSGHHSRVVDKRKHGQILKKKGAASGTSWKPSAANELLDVYMTRSRQTTSSVSIKSTQGFTWSPLRSTPASRLCTKDVDMKLEEPT